MMQHFIWLWEVPFFGFPDWKGGKWIKRLIALLIVPLQFLPFCIGQIISLILASNLSSVYIFKLFACCPALELIVPFELFSLQIFPFCIGQIISLILAPNLSSVYIWAMWFPTMWHLDKCRLRRASAASF